MITTWNSSSLTIKLCFGLFIYIPKAKGVNFMPFFFFTELLAVRRFQILKHGMFVCKIEKC